MAGKSIKERLFGRTEPKKDSGIRYRNRQEVISRLCGNADFRAFMFDVLDDLCLYASDEGILTEFGQGIRAAANRIKNRMLISKDAVKVLADFATKELTAIHKGIADAQKDNNNHRN
jgi:hypothetical protein